MIYELWSNGEKYDEIWSNGEEYVEAWSLVDGEKTLVWKKGGGNELYVFLYKGEIVKIFTNEDGFQKETINIESLKSIDPSIGTGGSFIYMDYFDGTWLIQYMPYSDAYAFFYRYCATTDFETFTYVNASYPLNYRIPYAYGGKDGASGEYFNPGAYAQQNRRIISKIDGNGDVLATCGNDVGTYNGYYLKYNKTTNNLSSGKANKYINLRTLVGNTSLSMNAPDKLWYLSNVTAPILGHSLHIKSMTPDFLDDDVTIEIEDLYMYSGSIIASYQNSLGNCVSFYSITNGYLMEEGSNIRKAFIVKLVDDDLDSIIDLSEKEIIKPWTRYENAPDTIKEMHMVEPNGSGAIGFIEMTNSGELIAVKDNFDIVQRYSSWENISIDYNDRYTGEPMRRGAEELTHGSRVFCLVDGKYDANTKAFTKDGYLFFYADRWLESTNTYIRFDDNE